MFSSIIPSSIRLCVTAEAEGSNAGVNRLWRRVRDQRRLEQRRDSF
jgi:hypothetical protein